MAIETKKHIKLHRMKLVSCVGFVETKPEDGSGAASGQAEELP